MDNAWTDISNCCEGRKYYTELNGLPKSREVDTVLSPWPLPRFLTCLRTSSGRLSVRVLPGQLERGVSQLPLVMFGDINVCGFLCAGSNNSFLVKNTRNGGVQMSRDPLNLTNKHSRKHAGFVNDKVRNR
jgi:hypothetical protein